MKKLLGYILIDNTYKDKIFKGSPKPLVNVAIFDIREFITHSISNIAANKKKYYICRVYKGDITITQNDIIINTNNNLNEPIKIKKCYNAILGTPRYIGDILVWRDMKNHGVELMSDNQILKNWLNNNINDKLCVEPRFKYNPILEMIHKMERSDSIATNSTISLDDDIFNEDVHINDFALKYKIEPRLNNSCKV